MNASRLSTLICGALLATSAPLPLFANTEPAVGESNSSIVQVAQQEEPGAAKPAEEAKPEAEQKADDKKKEEDKPPPPPAPAPADPAAPASPAAPADQAAAPAPADPAAAQDPSASQPAETPKQADPPAGQPAPASPAKEPGATPGQPASPAEASSAASSGETSTEAKSEEKKPWTIAATLSNSLGQGAFVDDEFARAVSWGYAVKLQGSYKFHELASVYLRFDFDQELTPNRLTTGTEAREFYFRETRLGLSAPSLYKEDFTGISLGAAASLRLPTDKEAQAAGRYFGWTLGGSAERAFENVGPGTITLGFATSFRMNVGPAQGSISATEAPSLVAAARPGNLDDNGDLPFTTGNTFYSFSNGVSVEYAFFEKFSIVLDLTFTNAIRHRLNESELPATFDGRPIRRSPNANDAVGQSDLVWGTVELGYTINDNFSLALGALTVSNPFIYNEGEPNNVRFPFWDFNEPANNVSQVYFDINFTY